MRQNRKTAWGIGRSVAERKVVMGDAAEDGHTGVRVTKYGGPHSRA